MAAAKAALVAALGIVLGNASARAAGGWGLGSGSGSGSGLGPGSRTPSPSSGDRDSAVLTGLEVLLQSGGKAIQGCKVGSTERERKYSESDDDHDDTLDSDSCALPQVAVVTNPSGVTRDLQLGVDVLAQEFGGAETAGRKRNKTGGAIVAVLGPEHGFRGIAPAGKSQAREEEEEEEGGTDG